MTPRRPTEPQDEKPAATTPTRARAKSSTPRAKKTATTKELMPVAVSEDVRRAMIAEAAYLRAERRGFGHGREHEDWLAAEAEVDALLEARHGGTSQ